MKNKKISKKEKEKDFKIFQKMCQHTTKVRKAMQKNSEKNKIPPRWVMKELMDTELEFSIDSYKKKLASLD